MGRSDTHSSGIGAFQVSLCVPSGLQVSSEPRQLNAHLLPLPTPAIRATSTTSHIRRLGITRPTPAERAPGTRRELPASSRVSAPCQGRWAPREARVPLLENERCPEGGPELQVMRTRPWSKRAAHTLSFTARRALRLSVGLAQEKRGASQAVGEQGGGARSAPAWGDTNATCLLVAQRRSSGCPLERQEAAAAVSRVPRRASLPLKMEKFLQIAPHSLAIVLGPAEGPAGERSGATQAAPPAKPRQLARHHIGYEIFADFKAENMQHFWNKKVTAAVAETFFLGWIDEQVLLIQGKEEHLEALREGWTRRALRPPSGFHIRCLGESGALAPLPRPEPAAGTAEGTGCSRGCRAPPSTARPAGGGAGSPLRAQDWGTSWHPKRGFVPSPHASWAARGAFLAALAARSGWVVPPRTGRGGGGGGAGG